MICSLTSYFLLLTSYLNLSLNLSLNLNLNLNLTLSLTLTLIFPITYNASKSKIRIPQSAFPLSPRRLVSLSVALKSDATGSILASSPALLLKEKGVDFVTSEEVNLTMQILFFVLPEARQHVLKIRNWSLEMFTQSPDHKLFTDVLEIKN